MDESGERVICPLCAGTGGDLDDIRCGRPTTDCPLCGGRGDLKEEDECEES
jgi:hypothetical protein